MLYNKPPKGIFTSLDDLDEKDGKICVQFESYSCGESNCDTFYLPLEFLFDESYPEKYKLIWEEEKRKEKEEKIKIELLKKENEKLRIEMYEIKEYERLRLKYMKDISEILPKYDESEEQPKEQPEGLYSDGTYLLVDYNNRIDIINLTDMNVIKTITNLSDVRKLQDNMKIACRYLTLDNNKFMSDLIQKHLNKED